MAQRRYRSASPRIRSRNLKMILFVRWAHGSAYSLVGRSGKRRPSEKQRTLCCRVLLWSVCTRPAPLSAPRGPRVPHLRMRALQSGMAEGVTPSIDLDATSRHTRRRVSPVCPYIILIVTNGSDVAFFVFDLKGCVSLCISPDPKSEIFHLSSSQLLEFYRVRVFG